MVSTKAQTGWGRNPTLLEFTSSIFSVVKRRACYCTLEVGPSSKSEANLIVGHFIVPLLLHSRNTNKQVFLSCLQVAKASAQVAMQISEIQWIWFSYDQVASVFAFPFGLEGKPSTLSTETYCHEPISNLSCFSNVSLFYTCYSKQEVHPRPIALQSKVRQRWIKIRAEVLASWTCRKWLPVLSSQWAFDPTVVLEWGNMSAFLVVFALPIGKLFFVKRHFW